MGGLLRVNEVFGPTIQGEGPSAGRRAVFLRLSGCNLTCSWCDTPYTWKWTEYDRDTETHPRDVTAVADQLRDLAGGHPAVYVITGGEPLVQQQAVAELVKTLQGHDRRRQAHIEIETNGTIDPTKLPMSVRLNVSPKLANSGVEQGRRYHPDVLRRLSNWPGVAFKFVVEDLPDLDEIAKDFFFLYPEQVWIMPQARDRTVLDVRTQAIIDAALARGWNLAYRQHVAIWNGERGR